MNKDPCNSPYWSGMSNRFAALSPPLCISPSEREDYFRLASEWKSFGSPPRVLVMGATPDFYHLPLPEGSDLLAVDWSADMLQRVWPGKKEQTLCQDWCDMNLPDASRDIAFCDGGLSFFKPGERMNQMANNLGRIVAPGGLFIVRAFIQAEQGQTPQDVFRELDQGKIRNNSELKMRLWFALNDDDGTGVKLHDVWQSFNDAFNQHPGSYEHLSWPDAEWQSMKAYKDIDSYYFFPTVSQITEAFGSSEYPFTLQTNLTPSAPCHQHLRILSFRRCN